MTTPFAPGDPDFEARVRASFNRQGVMRVIGARMTRVEPGMGEVELPFREDLTQQHGFIHAGIASTIAVVMKRVSPRRMKIPMSRST